MNDKISFKGKLDITIIDSLTGKIKEKESIDNLIVSSGKSHTMSRLLGVSQNVMSHMAIGTSSTAATINDVSLVAQLNRKAFLSVAQGTGGQTNQIEYTAQWGVGEGVGAIQEAGIFNASSGGVMLNRATFAVKNKETNDILIIKWTVING